MLPGLGLMEIEVIEQFRPWWLIRHMNKWDTYTTNVCTNRTGFKFNTSKPFFLRFLTDTQTRQTGWQKQCKAEYILACKYCLYSNKPFWYVHQFYTLFLLNCQIKCKKSAFLTLIREWRFRLSSERNPELTQLSPIVIPGFFSPNHFWCGICGPIRNVALLQIAILWRMLITEI